MELPNVKLKSKRSSHTAYFLNTWLASIEFMVAGQAIDLRKDVKLSPLSKSSHFALRKKIDPLKEDRALGEDIEQSRAVLKSLSE